jgi:N-acetylglucosamine kinase-like BadF-type ATPase
MGMGSILSPHDAQTNREIAVKIGLADSKSVFADNDAWNAHAGGLAGGPGILLISGTGSACLGRNARNKTWRAGGWGHLLHDAGSAYALGNAAMIAATRDADGRGQPTMLTQLVCKELGLRDLREIFRKIHHDGVSRAAVAAIAPGVALLAENGDAVAQQILSDGACGLTEMVVTVAHRLDMDAPALALTGGLITNATEFRKLFLESLTRVLPRFTLAEGGLAPVFGAVLLAFERSTGAAPSETFLQTLQRSGAKCTNLQ